MLSLASDRSNTLSPPPLSELSDSDRGSSAAPSPFESPASSRASIDAPGSVMGSCCKWGCCAAVTASFKSSQISGCQSFAALNLSWVLCSAFSWIFHNKLCNFLFRCGCTWNWAGSWDRYVNAFSISLRSSSIRNSSSCSCNVHNARGPRCPWCATPSGEYLLAAKCFTNHNCCTVIWPLAITLSISCSFPFPDYPNFLWAADGKLFTLAMVGAAAMAMRYFRIKNVMLRLLCLASCSILTWVFLGMLSALAFWQLTDYPYFMWFSKPPYPNQTDCTPNPCTSPA